ncbi:hypothetical protein F4777DRAFT_567783 [Nemania sp. FL0916]|nr:hypothetical protein F4777DRAFT_567783 [Nemania sp. FL0916]
MMMAMMVILWEESKSEGDGLDQLSRGQTDMISTLTRIDNTTRSLHETFVQFGQSSAKMDWRQREIFATIWSSSWSPQQTIQDSTEAKGQEGNLNTDDDAAYSEAVINSLFLDELRYREGAISETYESTFQWVFQSPSLATDGHPRWSDFAAWLRGPDSDVYWITGKPGSGKSTLMKYITGHSMSQQLLTQWSGVKPFVLARFYFWNAGTPIQRTREGLLRTLLHQCLMQQPQLIPLVCPRRWALFKVFGRKAIKAAPTWTWKELHESFSAFDLHAGEQFNLTLFIDGLDELDGNHSDLLNFVRLFHSKPGRKICVSSRPWNIFEDAFTRKPSLRLESLTYNDIQVYTQGCLKRSPAFQEYNNALHQQSSDLVGAVVTRAQGVFLWVFVV